jgi:hypothetical protein
MKALNHKEVTKKYLLFLLNFTALLAVTVVCYFFYLKADQQQSRLIVEKESEHEYIFTKRQELEQKVDSLLLLLNMTNTNQVGDEAALEHRIAEIQNEATEQLERLKTNGDPVPYLLFEKIVSNVEYALNSKNALRKVREEEAAVQEKLDACKDADNKIKKQLRNSK